MPDDTEREALVARRDELADSLRPTPGKDRNSVILKLIAASPSFGMGPAESAMLVGLYAEALEDLPTWAIDEARRRFAKHKHKCLWDGRGTPSSGHVYAEARLIILPVEEEIGRLDLILTAVPVDTDTTDDERAKALAHWQQIRAEILSTNSVDGANQPKNLQVAGLRETNMRNILKEHAAMAAAGIAVPASPDGLTISRSLRATIDRGTRDRRPVDVDRAKRSSACPMEA